MGLEWSELCRGVAEQLVSILFVQQCALCIVSCVVHVSSCCITASWLYLSKHPCSQQVHCIMWLYQLKLKLMETIRSWRELYWESDCELALAR